MVNKDKFTYGPSGSGVSRADGFTKNPPDMDTDKFWQYRVELIAPPVKLPEDDKSIEEFESLLDESFGLFDEAIEDLRMLAGDETVEDVEEMLFNPEQYLLRIQKEKSYRAAKSAKEHFAIIERNAWNRDQIVLLDMLDNDKYKAKVDVWNKRKMKLEARMDEARDRIIEHFGKDAYAQFREFGENQIKLWKPEDKPDYIKYLHKLARRMAIWDEPSLMTITWLNKVAPTIVSREVPTAFTRILIGQFYEMAKKNDYDRYAELSEQFRIAFGLE